MVNRIPCMVKYDYGWLGSGETQPIGVESVVWIAPMLLWLALIMWLRRA